MMMKWMVVAVVMMMVWVVYNDGNLSNDGDDVAVDDNDD